jgi:tetratricopeptide (TPR) repeat protein
VRSRDRIAVAAVAVALGFAGVAFGGATRWAACLAALLAVGSALPHLTSRRTASRLSPLVVLVLIAVVGTALQLVPLPMAIAEIVAAEKLALVRDHARALGETPPIWTVASHDPPATLVELAKLIGYLGLAWGATRIAAQRRARPWLAAAVVGAAALIALVTLAHRLVGATAVYGSFTMPERGGAPGPIINPNHLASLTALAAPLAFALGLHWRGRLRAAALLAALMLAATAFLTGSRGGAVGLLAGAVVTGIVLVAQRRAGVVDDDRRAPVAITIPAAIVAACAVALLGTVAARDVVHQVGSTELTELSERGSKYQVWGQAAPMIAEHRWLGVGRGSFEPAFTRRSPIAELTYSHVENSYLQAAVDWGVPIALALALAVLALGRAALRRWRHGPLEAGALGALTAVAVHELADFSLELPVVAMATLATAAVLAPSRLGTGEDRHAPVSRPVLLRRLAAVVVAVAIIGLAALPLGRAAAVERAALPPAASDGAVAAAIRVLHRHPSDALAAGHLAAALWARRDPRAPAVIGRALYLRPTHGGLHLLAARMLAASQRPRQAAVEYALAVAGARDVAPIIDELLTRLPTVDDRARALPDDPRQIWRVCGALTARGRFDVILAYTRRLVERDPGLAAAQQHRALAAAALDLPDEALAAAAAAHRLGPTAITALIHARALARVGRRAEAIAALRAAPETAIAAQVREVAFELAALTRATGDLAGAREVLAAAAAARPRRPRHRGRSPPPPGRGRGRPGSPQSGGLGAGPGRRTRPAATVSRLA